MKLLVATRSQYKMREIRELLGDLADLELLSLDDEGVPYSDTEEGLEPYETFEENARSKADYFHRLTGLPTVADDSGLVVDVLGGAPGVRSKRFAPVDGLSGQGRDDANNRHLLERLQGVAEPNRTARYVCVAAFGEPGSEIVTFRGEAPGVIVDVSAGLGGFGYDPHFYDVELGRTFAEVSAEEKNLRSHRGRAFRALARYLDDRGA